MGEYYTPRWLARTMVAELIEDPLRQRVLDPACGSGTFVAEAVDHFIQASRSEGLEPKDTLDRLANVVTGIDVHPVAVHLARSAWVLAARPAIQAATDAGYDASVTVPIYLGDALQLRFRGGDMFAEYTVTIQVGDDQNTELVFPVSLVERPNDFDSLMDHVADAIEREENPLYALDDNGITDPNERATLESTIATLQSLHTQGRDHIWAYYTRNLVRPVALSHTKVDVIIGNPPWINYNQTANTLRTELQRQSRDVYGIWAGGRYATHQDVAGLFFTRSVDLYLKPGGVIGMVMPHSALQAGQYSKWRTGQWRGSGGAGTLAVDFDFKTAWDLESLTPNSFFPIPSCVVFATWVGPDPDAKGHPLSGSVERWLGKAGSAKVTRGLVPISDTSVDDGSPYSDHSRQGATIVPRCLFFVEEAESPVTVQTGQTVTVNPRRGNQDKEPWRSLDLNEITGQTIEEQHVFEVHLGETLVPYVMLDPLKAVLPLTHSDSKLPTDDNGPGGIDLGELSWRMRTRWRTVSELWERSKARSNKLNLLGQLDYMRKLTSQLDWQLAPGENKVRVVYGKSGRPTAAIVEDSDCVVDHLLYWVTCGSVDEAEYLLAIVNSDTLYESAQTLMSKGQFGARDLHKHLWKLPIPEFDEDDPLHVRISEAGKAASEGAALKLEQLRDERDRVTVTIARREIRKWLASSDEGHEVEEAVSELLGS